jgi:hypothetical protein
MWTFPGGTAALVRRAVLHGVPLLLLCHNLAAQNPRGRLRGIVIDDLGNPLGSAEVIAVSTDERTVSARTGQFEFEVTAGLQSFMVRAIGYRPSFTAVNVVAGQVAGLRVQLKPLIQRLEPLVVTETSGFAALADFERRRALGGGFYLTRAEVERAGSISISGLIRRFPVLRVADSLGVPQAYATRSQKLVALGGTMVVAPCPMRLALDGQLLPAGTTLDFMLPSAVGGIEIYPGPATIPVEISAGARDISCGLIMIWSRRR